MMEFEDHEEEEVEDEELEEEEEEQQQLHLRPTSFESSMANSSSRPFVMSNQTPPGLTAAVTHNEARSLSPPPFPLSLSIPPGKKTPARYRECLKNHAVGIGGHAVDGCGEFMPAGPEGSLDALKCAACNCHRNFHRKEVDLLAAQNSLPVPQNHHYRQVHAPIAYYPHPHPHPISQFYPYSRASAGEIHHRPLALPSTSGGGGEVDEAEMMLDPMSSGKKRFRTKFTPEQKEKMRDLAERMGWRMQKQDEAAVQQFCEETGVRRHVLKVWMHNNKHTLGKKP